MGITKGCLPNSVNVDEATSVKHEAYMTMNGLEVDTENEEYTRKVATLSSVPASLVHEAMQMTSDICKKYFETEQRDHNRSQQSIFHIIEQIQYVLIALQDAVLHRQEIKAAVNAQSAKIPTTRQEAIDMKDTLQLNLAMQEKSECKTTRSAD